ncbi:MAG TPA: hypothetical protein VEK33_21880 [Terriglobales bacterium]|nr:hypothetical protein [Terriglobales bacterium]
MPETSHQPDTALKTTDYPGSPLIAYTLRGLRSCWMPESGRWSHIYHLDGRAEPNESVPESDVFYSLNVLLGFSRIAHLELNHGFDLPQIFQQTVALVPKLDSPKYAYGMALWAGAALALEIPGETLAAITSLVEERKHWKTFRAQDLGMILIGCVEQAARSESRRWAATAHDLFAFLRQHYSCPSGLFFDQAAGSRRGFSSFATHTYLTLASYLYGEWSGNEQALRLAKESTRKLIELQGPQGEWPWFYYTPGGRVVDFYEIYSVHQQGMAPAFLECAERHGVAGATEALVKGFKWIFGQNQMNRSMLWKREGLICRSQIRKGELQHKWKRAVRAIAKALTGASATMIDPSQLELRLECRSYELGWILWSFGRRTDLTEIVCHSDFC